LLVGWFGRLVGSVGWPVGWFGWFGLSVGRLVRSVSRSVGRVVGWFGRSVGRSIGWLVGWLVGLLEEEEREAEAPTKARGLGEQPTVQSSERHPGTHRQHVHLISLFPFFVSSLKSRHSRHWNRDFTITNTRP
jgi:hypothetical protein